MIAYNSDIYHSMPKFSGIHPDLNNYEFYSPPLQSGLPGCLYRCAFGVPSRKRRRRRGRRGRRGGVAVRLRLAWAAGSSSTSASISAFLNLAGHSRLSRGATELNRLWIRPIAPCTSSGLVQRTSPRFRRRSVNHHNLRSLRSALYFPQDPPQLRMALANVRSLFNKTFICNDFISSNNLNYFFVTESWIKTGDLSVFFRIGSPGVLQHSTVNRQGRWTRDYF